MPAKKDGSKSRKSAKKSATTRTTTVQSALVDALELEILALADERIEDLVDADDVRRLIERSDDLVDHERIGELAGRVARRIATDLRKLDRSPRDLLDEELTARLDRLLDADVELSEEAEDLIARMMRQDLIQDLFTNVIHTSIVSFNKRVNPLFGGLATAMLEDQIKGFIRFFIPMVLDQATSFVVADRNQELFSDFARSLVRELLEEPIPDLLGLVTSEAKRDPADAVQTLARSAALRELGRKVALVAFEEVYAASRTRKLGEFLELEDHAGWLAEQIAPSVARALERPHLRAYLESEFGSAKPVKKKAKKKVVEAD